jgi:hypothetical protein
MVKIIVTNTSSVSQKNFNHILNFNVGLRRHNLLTYSTEQSSSWKDNWFAASQKIPRVLWNPKVPHRTHKRLARIPILSQSNPVLTPTSHFLKSHPDIILPSTPGSPQRSLSLMVPHQNPVHISPFPHTCYMPGPSQSSRFYHPHDDWEDLVIFSIVHWSVNKKWT